MNVWLCLQRFAAMLLILIVGICGVPAAVLATGHIDAGREASLRVYFGENGTGFPGVSFSMYHAADVSETGVYTLTGDFAKYPVSLEDLDSAGWRALAQTLAAYAARDELPPLQMKTTGQDGECHFSGLTAGLYLVIGERYTAENAVYTPEPMLVSLPGQTEDDWNYDAEAICKFDREDTPAETICRKVQKVWKDQGGEGKRPEEIAVQLLENGRVADTITLSKENNWEYTWKNLDGNSRWQIAEAKVPNGYTVTISQEGTICIITNTRPYEPPPKLPQTGMLWWPVPVLACGGLLLIVTGLVVRRRQGDGHEKKR